MKFINKKLMLMFGTIISLTALTAPIIVSCSNQEQDKTNGDPSTQPPSPPLPPSPPTITPQTPILRNVTISPNKYEFNVNEAIEIESKLDGEYLESANIIYQWSVKKANSDRFEVIASQTANKLSLNATEDYHNAAFKLEASLNDKHVSSNEITINVNTNLVPPQPENPSPTSTFVISTNNNRVNVGSGITIRVSSDSENVEKYNFQWWIKKQGEDWKPIDSDINLLLTTIITDISFDRALIKASTVLNNKTIETNEIMISVDTKNYIPNHDIIYSNGQELTPPSVPSGNTETRKFPFDVSKNLIKSFKVNGKPQEIIKLNEFGDTFTVFIEEDKDYQVEIELNTNYSEYGVNMGFKNPTVSFYKTVFDSGTQVVNDGHYNRVVDINKLSINRPTHFIQVTGIIQEPGFRSQEFQVKINLRNKFINKLVEGEDYFKLDNMYITNPYTTNEALKNKYGNVPLPIMKDGKLIDPLAEVSKEDLFRMFHLIISQKWQPLMRFGSRKIWSEYFVNTFVEWLVKNWKYYPEFNFNNPRLYLTTNYPHWFFDQYRLNDINNDPQDGVDLTFYGYETLVNNQYSGKGPNIEQFMNMHYQAKDIYMTELQGFNIAERMSYSSIDQDKFFEGISLFFSNYIRPGMSEKDKVFAVYMFVSDWLRYQGDASHDAYGFWSNHVGVCANYGGITAYLLNLIDIPAIPILTGDVDDNPKRMLHMNTWIYLDAENNGRRQWYMQDSTWIDNTWGQGSTWPGVRFRGKGDNDPNTFKLLLTDVYKKKYGDYEYDPVTWAGLEYLLYHNNFFGFFGAQWFDPFIRNDVSYGSYDIKQESWMVNLFDNNLLSKPAFHNGYWYFFDNNDKFVKTKLIGNAEQVVDLSKNVPPWVKDKLNKNSGGISMAQFGKYVFISRPTYTEYHNVFNKEDNKWWIVHNLEDESWSDTRYIEFDPTTPIKFAGGTLPIKDTALLTFFFDENKMLNLELQGPGPSKKEWKQSLIFKFNIFDLWPEELAGLDIGSLNTTTINDNNTFIEGDDNIAYQYYTAMGNGIGITKDKDSNITPIQKQNYNQKLKNIMNNQSLSANEKAIKMKQAFENLKQASLKVEISDTVINQVSRDLYELETKYFNESFGILFDLKDGFESFNTMGVEQTNSTVRYNIWYSPTKNGNFELIAKELYEPRIVKEYFKPEQSPSGYYYIQYYTLKNPNNYKYSQKIKVVVQDSMFNNLPLVPEFEIWRMDPALHSFQKHHSTSSNYTKFNPQWAYLPYELRLKWNNVAFYPDIYDKIDVSLNFINKDGTVNNEHIQTITSKNQNIYINKSLGMINASNSGAYYVQFKYTAKSGEVFNTYTRIYYMLEFSDVVNNNFQPYINISKKIIDSVTKSRNI